MESTLHQQLKALYGATESDREVWVSGYRIDAVTPEHGLIEIQSAPLAALRGKIADLLEQKHRVLVVKPIAVRRQLLMRARRGGDVESRRLSPKRGTRFELFDELVNFVEVFPHPRLTLEVLLIEIEEHRVRTRPRGRWRREFRVDDRMLTNVGERLVLRTAADLKSWLPTSVPTEFTTADVAREAGIPRWLAQKLAYCLRKIGAIDLAGKEGNSLVYRRVARPRRRRAA
jgi:hypothetical protein